MSDSHQTKYTRRDAATLLAGATTAAQIFRPALARAEAASPASTLLASFSADEAGQAVAVDDGHVYAITNAAIGKYRKDTGARVAQWRGEEEGAIRHLNAGLVLDGQLYCTNSNYPELPMASSIEIFDPDTLAHQESISLGIDVGSATWLERKDGDWFVTFAHYEGRGGTPGKDNTYTQMVRFDSQWRRTGGWVFPPDVLAAFAPQSNSGGVFGKEGLIYATAHHNTELYVLKFPTMGPVLETVAVLPNTTEGQGIAWDPAEDRVLWGISRARREVVSWRIPQVI